MIINFAHMHAHAHVAYACACNVLELILYIFANSCIVCVYVRMRARGHKLTYYVISHDHVRVYVCIYGSAPAFTNAYARACANYN